ncbi:CapA family protein [Azospira restricta]|uniref:CapA family protein n=1 Tax=Azospira restricta TaxID=404405 RepID=A0A974PWU3_9RHOO|nr:CapA family protein [Azospira restricta]QRJ62865.1 CapA family protein [Azospira restricta]
MSGGLRSQLCAILAAACALAPLPAAAAGELVAAPIAVGIAERAAPVVRLLFVGDVMLDDGPGRAIAAGRDPFADFADEFDRADVRIGNLETAIASGGEPIPGKFYAFRASPRVIDRLAGRFDALSVANNHSGDYGPEAFVETLSLLDIAGIQAFGGGRNLAEAHQPAWIEHSGLRIAILGYNEYKPRAFEAGPDWPGVAWSEDGHVLRGIAAARAAGADIVIPFMHWGWEGEREPSPRQRELARRMIDAGAAAVVGAHPHVTQGSETYRGRPIVYSLGNFVFDSFDSPAEREGWLLRLTVGADGVSDWQTIPAWLDDEGLPRRQPLPAPR